MKPIPALNNGTGLIASDGASVVCALVGLANSSRRHRHATMAAALEAARLRNRAQRANGREATALGYCLIKLSSRKNQCLQSPRARTACRSARPKTMTRGSAIGINRAVDTGCRMDNASREA